MYEEKTKEINTVKEVWIYDPNYHKIQVYSKICLIELQRQAQNNDNNIIY